MLSKLAKFKVNIDESISNNIKEDTRLIVDINILTSKVIENESNLEETELEIKRTHL